LTYLTPFWLVDHLSGHGRDQCRRCRATVYRRRKQIPLCYVIQCSHIICCAQAQDPDTDAQTLAVDGGEDDVITSAVATASPPPAHAPLPAALLAEPIVASPTLVVDEISAEPSAALTVVTSMDGVGTTLFTFGQWAYSCLSNSGCGSSTRSGR
jgi:hypothetical protein